MGFDGVSLKVEVPSPATARDLGVSSSTWKTPLPYLFGGLASMFFLISMSLLFLACSYWRYTNRLERDVEAGRRDEQNSRRGENDGIVKVAFKEKFAVIMPGDENPTCLATPKCYRGFGSVSDDEDEKQKVKWNETAVKVKSGSDETTSYVDEANRSPNAAVD